MTEDTMASRSRLHARMGRPGMEIGTHGKIRAREVGGMWIARTRVRDDDGVVRDVFRKRASKGEAIAALRDAIASRPGFGDQPSSPALPSVSPNRLVSSRRRDQHHVLYRFFDANDALLYVGISLHGLQRMGQHQSGKLWWPSVSRTTLEHFPDRESAREAERVAIAGEHPRFNIAS